jgi:sugar lactone lactonase YvrE
MPRFWKHVLITVLALGLAACAGPPVTPAPSAQPPAGTPPASDRPSATPAPSATATATATASPTATALPPTATPSPPVPGNPRLVVLAENLPGPDDLALAPDGSLYISDVVDGTIRQYTPDGRVLVLTGGLSEPEGIVVLPDGVLVIAEQGRNRLVRYDPQTQTLAPLLALENRTGLLGVDAIVLDTHVPGTATLVIPDSPNGVVLRAGLDGGTVTEIARGFDRPTGAWVEADGSILVVDENGGTLERIRPDGTRAVLARLPIPDDVIEDAAGNLFVNTLGDDAIHLIAAGTHEDRVLASGLSDPQGIVFDADGNLVVTDPGHHRLVKLVIRGR